MMKEKVLVLILMLVFTTSIYAKKDPEAWKNEKSLTEQFSVFKKNLNFWDGYIFFKEYQIDEMFSAVTDTVKNLEGVIQQNRSKITALNSEISSLNSKVEQTQKSLDESLGREDSFTTMGIQLAKGTFAIIMYSISGLLLVVVVLLLFFFNQNNIETKESKDKFEDLYKEFESYKKNNLERVTKLNKDLHDAKMKLGEL
jgi:peptidoglycan hydrolase CwlO-like protein